MREFGDALDRVVKLIRIFERDFICIGKRVFVEPVEEHGAVPHLVLELGKAAVLADESAFADI